MSKLNLNKYLIISIFLIGSTINAVEKDPQDFLLESIKAIDYKMIEKALKEGADINKIYRNTSPLSYAVKEHNDIKLIRFLLKHGAHPNEHEEDDFDYPTYIPLGKAVIMDDKPEITIILLLAGALRGPIIRYKRTLDESLNTGSLAIVQAWPEIRKFLTEEIAITLDKTNLLIPDLNKIIAEYACDLPEEEIETMKLK